MPAGDRDFGHFQDTDQLDPVHPVCKFATQTGGDSGGENEHPRRERHDPWRTASDGPQNQCGLGVTQKYIAGRRGKQADQALIPQRNEPD